MNFPKLPSGLSHKSSVNICWEKFLLFPLYFHFLVCLSCCLIAVILLMLCLSKIIVETKVTVILSVLVVAYSFGVILEVICKTKRETVDNRGKSLKLVIISVITRTTFDLRKMFFQQFRSILSSRKLYGLCLWLGPIIAWDSRSFNFSHFSNLKMEKHSSDICHHSKAQFSNQNIPIEISICHPTIRHKITNP